MTKETPTFSSCLQYVKERLSRTQSQVYLSYAEAPVFFSAAKERLSRTQSQVCLSYAEAKMLFSEAKERFSLVGRYFADTLDTETRTSRLGGFPRQDEEEMYEI